jgi:AcrR family transcriptional regulator
MKCSGRYSQIRSPPGGYEVVMGYRHSRADILDAALAAAVEDGLSKLSFGRVAARLGIADRTVVYYFPTKDDLISAVVLGFGVQLMGVLDTAFGSEPLTHQELLRRAWPALTSPEADRVFRVFFEFAGLASAQLPPYRDLAAPLFDLWFAWLEPKLDAPDPRAAALMVVTVIDGLLLLRHTCGPATAGAAAAAMGISG